MTDDHSLGPRDETMLLYVDLHYHVLFGCNETAPRVMSCVIKLSLHPNRCGEFFSSQTGTPDTYPLLSERTKNNC